MEILFKLKNWYFYLKDWSIDISNIINPWSTPLMVDLLIWLKDWLFRIFTGEIVYHFIAEIKLAVIKMWQKNLKNPKKKKKKKKKKKTVKIQLNKEQTNKTFDFIKGRNKNAFDCFYPSTASSSFKLGDGLPKSRCTNSLSSDLLF